MHIETTIAAAIVIAMAAVTIAAGARETHLHSAEADAAKAQFKRDLAAAKVCQGKPFEWEGKTLICHKEAR